MRLVPGMTRDEALEALRAAAARTWGAERQAALEPALETAAGALARLAASPLDLLEDEPDFVGGGPRRAGSDL